MDYRNSYLTSAITGAFAIAAEEGNTEVVRALMRSGIVPDASAHAHALCVGIKGKNKEVVSALLALNVDPDRRGEACQPPLIEAVREGHINLIRLLVGQGASPSVKDQYGNTATEVAVVEDNVSAAYALAGLRPPRGDVEKGFNERLIQAVHQGNAHEVRTLLSLGAAPSINGSSCVALTRSIRKGHPGLVRAFLNARAGPENPAEICARATIEAIEQGQLSIVRILVEKGGVFKHTDDTKWDGDWALGKAVARGHIEIVRYLLNVGVPIKTKHLEKANENGHDEIGEVIIKTYHRRH